MGKKKLGIVGGMGAVAAAYFFKRLVELTPATTDQEYIETFLHNNSAVPDRTKGILYGGPSPLPELQRSVAILDSMGADILLFACMTSHYFIPELRKSARAEIVDGIAATVEHILGRAPSVRKVGVLASSGALGAGLFQRELEKIGVQPVTLSAGDQETYFMEPIYKEWGIKAGHYTGEPRERFLRAVELLLAAGAEAVIAGCSEVPLVLRQADLSVPLYDAIDIMLLKAIGLCLGRPV